jgi:hypothetical protein
MFTTVTSGQLTKFLGLLDQHNMTPERFQSFLARGIFSDLFDEKAKVRRPELRDALDLPVVLPDNRFLLTVDYERKVPEIIESLDLPYATEHWKDASPATFNLVAPFSGVKRVVGRLPILEGQIHESHTLLMRRLHENGCRPANVWEGLAFYARYPAYVDLLVCYGTRTAVAGRLRVPCISNPSPRHREVFPEHHEEIGYAHVKHAGWASFAKFLVIEK